MATFAHASQWAAPPGAPELPSDVPQKQPKKRGRPLGTYSENPTPRSKKWALLSKEEKQERLTYLAATAPKDTFRRAYERQLAELTGAAPKSIRLMSPKAPPSAAGAIRAQGGLCARSAQSLATSVATLNSTSVAKPTPTPKPAPKPKPASAPRPKSALKSATPSGPTPRPPAGNVLGGFTPAPLLLVARNGDAGPVQHTNRTFPKPPRSTMTSQSAMLSIEQNAEDLARKEHEAHMRKQLEEAANLVTSTPGSRVTPRPVPVFTPQQLVRDTCRAAGVGMVMLGPLPVVVPLGRCTVFMPSSMPRQLLRQLEAMATLASMAVFKTRPGVGAPVATKYLESLKDPTVAYLLFVHAGDTGSLPTVTCKTVTCGIADGEVFVTMDRAPSVTLATMQNLPFKVLG